jgi:hypothetical protein
MAVGWKGKDWTQLSKSALNDARYATTVGGKKLSCDLEFRRRFAGHSLWKRRKAVSENAVSV